MLALKHIDLDYGTKCIFKDVNLYINSRDRIGLVGSNGTGKSTLLKILTGELSSDKGDIEKANYVTVGYLAQEINIESQRSLYEEAESAFEDIKAIQGHLERAQIELSGMDSDHPQYQETLSLMGEWQHRLDELDVYKLQSKTERILMGLGFSLEDMKRPCYSFSGGWQMRIALAKLLLKEPSLLLLDEPTNHLDLDSLYWLENYLKSYDGALMLVSHDRSFLDNITQITAHLSQGKLQLYKGNYSFFEDAFARQQEQQEKEFANQQKQIAHMQQFIDRFRYKAKKASMVQSRIKALEKIDRLELDNQESHMLFRFPEPVRSGETVLTLKGICKSYGEKEVLHNIDLEILRGDRIAVVGVNGAGKSTLARIMAAEENYQAGERKLGTKVEISFFGQHQAQLLDQEMDVYDAVLDVCSRDLRPQIRSILGSFLFRGDDVYKKIKVLSGGEKNRLALARMLVKPANCLIFDEPTNHLDMRSKEVLKNALLDYQGTILIVSHDRDFLNPLVEKVIEVKAHTLRTYLGNVDAYQEKVAAASVLNEANQRGNKRNASNATSSANLSPKERRRLEAEHRQKLAPIKKAIKDLELQIENYETEIDDWEAQMADPQFYQQEEKTAANLKAYEKAKANLEASLQAWEDNQEKLSQLES